MNTPREQVVEELLKEGKLTWYDEELVVEMNHEDVIDLALRCKEAEEKLATQIQVNEAEHLVALGLKDQVREAEEKVRELETVLKSLSDDGMYKYLVKRIRLEYGAELTRLRGLCAATYQAAGVCEFPEKWLDALSAAANEKPFDPEPLLPFDMKDSAVIALLQRQCCVRDDYIALLQKSLNDCIGFLHAHQWKWPEEDIEKGRELRAQMLPIPPHSEGEEGKEK